MLTVITIMIFIPAVDTCSACFFAHAVYEIEAILETATRLATKAFDAGWISYN